MKNEYNPEGKEIRFIDSQYRDLFRIPDGGCIQVHYPDETVVKPCKFLDEYHTEIGHNVYHICQFAEVMERIGASYMAEPEIMGDEAAWQVGRNRILAVQASEGGYDYTLYDGDYRALDGGRVENPDLTMIEVRRDILESFGLERRELRALFSEEVQERAALANAPARADGARRDSVLGRLETMRAEPGKPGPKKQHAAER